MAATTNVHGFNIGGNNNSFDQRGHFYRGILDGNVSGMLVKQNSTPNMTVLVEHGSALLNKNTNSASVAEIKADTSVTIDTANTSNPRIDTVVIYEDTSVTIPTAEASYWQDGAGGRFKLISLPGTAAASPVALSNASIQTAIGAGKPWTRLADITVPANTTTIINSNISDKRALVSGTIPNGSITAQKIDFSTFTPTTSSGWTISADGRRAMRRLSTTGLQPFGGIGGAYWTQTIPLTLPTGFTNANTNYSVTRVAGGTEEMRLTAGIMSSGELALSNLSTTSIGSASTAWVNDILLEKKV